MNKLISIFILFVSAVANLFCQQAGSSILLDGLNDYVMVPHHSSLNPGTGSWSILLWIKPVDELRRSPLVTKRQPHSGFDQYSLGIADTDPHNPVPGKKIYYNYIDNSGVSERSGISTEDLADTSWFHIAIIADLSKDSIILYKDGIRQNYNLMYNFGSWPNINNTDSLFIGFNNVMHYYKGQIDELSLWSKALTHSQVISVKSDTLSYLYYSSPDSGLAGYWRFDVFEDLGIGNPGTDDIRDFSYRGNHGDAEGNPVLVNSGIPIGINVFNEILPAEYFLYQNFPNPFNPVTRIVYSVPKQSFVTLKIYDVLGREVKLLVNGMKTAGTYEVDWDAGNFSSGVYFYRMETGEFSDVRKMAVLK